MKAIILPVRKIREIEEETEKKFGISRLILMENAGRAVAESVAKRFSPVIGRKISVFCGKGNNGGDGFVVARYLFNMGAIVKVLHSGEPSKFSFISFTNLQILYKMNIPVVNANEGSVVGICPERPEILIDAIFGSGIKGEIKGIEAEMIAYINSSKSFILSADIPSGLDPDTGTVAGDAVCADVTVSFGFSKEGFYIKDGPGLCGDIEIADIGFPRFFYGQV